MGALIEGKWSDEEFAAEVEFEPVNSAEWIASSATASRLMVHRDSGLSMVGITCMSPMAAHGRIALSSFGS